MAKVSIVVPIYNVERYLARCLDSCINQSFKDIEIICVNDGSTDKSPEILRAYANLDSRIKIITKENGGLSSARNVGVEAAQGEYILYVDSDDYISHLLLERVYENSQKNNSDVVVFDYCLCRSNVEERKLLTIEPFADKYVNSTFNADSVDDVAYKYVPASAWIKFYKTDLLKKNSITFDEGLIFEDVSYWAKVFVAARRISYINEPLYSYFVGRDTQIMARNDEKLFDIINIYQIVEDTFKKAGYYEKFKHSIDILMIMDSLKKLSMIKPELKQDLFYAIKALNKDIDYEYYEKDEIFIFERLCARNFKLLNSVANYEEYMRVQKEVTNV